jgi:hypothetical protein
MVALVVVIVIVFIGGVIALTVVFSKKSVVRRALKNAPYKRIHEVQNGEKARIVGKIVYAGQVLQSPLSKRHCAAYRVEVQEYRQHGKSGSWITVINDEKKGDIVIHDGMGNALIDPQSVQTLMVQDAGYQSGTFKNASPELEEYLRLHGRASTGFLGFNKSLRYNEGILEQGELVAAVGVGTWHSAQAKGLKLPADRVLVLGPDEKGKLYITDEPKLIITDQPA